MHALSVEYREVGSSLLRDLISQVYDRSMCGKIVVVTEKPIAMLSSFRKQWMHVQRRTHVELASTMKPERSQELIYRIAHMERLLFSAKAPKDTLDADVTFITAEDAVNLAPVCRTMYVTYTFPRIKLHMMTSWMPINSLVVIYDQN